MAKLIAIGEVNIVLRKNRYNWIFVQKSLNAKFDVVILGAENVRLYTLHWSLLLVK
jgi:hypothetical protein